MTERHNDKDGKPLHTGDLVHFTVDGHPYTGIIHALVRRDHEPAILTLVQLFLPTGEVTKETPEHQDAGDEKNEDDPENSTGYVHPAVIQKLNEREDAKKERADPNQEKQQEPKDTKHQDAGNEKPRDSHDHRTEPKETTPQGEKNEDDKPSAPRHQSEATAHSNQQQPKPAEPNRGSTLAEPKKGSK